MAQRNMQLADPIRAHVPWENMRKYGNDGGGKPSKLDATHHRGWTLVDVGRWRYAVRDGTNERRRVCHETNTRATTLFRELVDRIEDER